MLRDAIFIVNNEDISIQMRGKGYNQNQLENISTNYVTLLQITLRYLMSNNPPAAKRVDMVIQLFHEIVSDHNNVPLYNKVCKFP